MVNIFYHKKDLDGHCSGAIARYYYETLCKEKVKMFPIDYPDNFPIEELTKEDTVLFVDFSISNLETIKRLDNEFNFIIIDHHKSFIKFVNDNRLLLKGKLLVGYGACELAWDTFIRNRKVPKIVRLLGRYDVYDHTGEIADWSTVIYPFQLGMKSIDLDPKKDEAFQEWKLILTLGKREEKNYISQTIKDGIVIDRFMNIRNAMFTEMFSFEADFGGLRALCMNSTESNSVMFASRWNTEKHDIIFRYNFNGEKFIVSLYSDSDKIDCSEIAKNYDKDGGGHHGAAGFTCKNIIFENGKITIK